MENTNLSKHNLGNLLLLGKIGVFHNRRNASSRLLLLISKHLILCIYLVVRILAWSGQLNASNLFLSLILDLGNLFLIVQLHFSKLFLILKSGVNHTSRGSISTSTLPSIKLRKCSSKIITSILSFISGRLATKSNQIKQLIRNGRSASLFFFQAEDGIRDVAVTGVQTCALPISGAGCTSSRICGFCGSQARYWKTPGAGLIYPMAYFLAWAAALQFHAWLNPGSLAPTLGASGAVAALMGAFLVRFPKTKKIGRAHV